MPDHPSGALGGAFRKPFAEQVAFFRQKMGNTVPTRRWDDLTGAQHDTAFTVAGAQKAELLADFAASIDRAIAEGIGLGQFEKDFDAAVERHDWHGWTGEGTKGGRAWRVRTIYRTNAYTSYAAGRFAQLKSENWPLWIYLHGGSRDPRPEHLDVFDGLVLPPDHPFWEKHYPPSDWGCSCYVIGTFSMKAAKLMGGTKTAADLPDGWDRPDPRTGEPAGVGKGWSYAPGASVAAAVAAKVKTWPAEIGRDFLGSLSAQTRADVLRATEPPLTHVDQLSGDERAAIRDYTSLSYREINETLRNGGGLLDEGKPIDRALDRARLAEAATVYRGVTGDGAALLRAGKLARGDIVRDAGFMSTSRLRDRGELMADETGGTGVLLIIHLKSGSRALDVASLSHLPREQEILVQRGAAMRVLRWDAKTGVLEVEIDG